MSYISILSYSPLEVFVERWPYDAQFCIHSYLRSNFCSASSLYFLFSVYFSSPRGCKIWSNGINFWGLRSDYSDWHHLRAVHSRPVLMHVRYCWNGTSKNSEISSLSLIHSKGMVVWGGGVVDLKNTALSTRYWKKSVLLAPQLR